jgi:predicted aspartyl protease
MTYGYFTADSNLPYVQIGIVLGGSIFHCEFVLDTGFSGDLKIDPHMAKDLGIASSHWGRLTNANGEHVSVDPFGVKPLEIKIERETKGARRRSGRAPEG